MLNTIEIAGNTRMEMVLGDVDSRFYGADGTTEYPTLFGLITGLDCDLSELRLNLSPPPQPIERKKLSQELDAKKLLHGEAANLRVPGDVRAWEILNGFKPGESSQVGLQELVDRTNVFLPHEYQNMLLTKIRSNEEGHETAVQLTILNSLPFIAAMVRKYGDISGGPEWERMMSYGVSGLLDALDKLDENYRTENNPIFVNFARFRVVDAILQGIQDDRSGGSQPLHVLKRGVRIKMVEDKLTGRLGRMPTMAEIAEEISVKDFTANVVARYIDRNLPFESLDIPIGNSDHNEEALTLGDSITSQEADIADKVVEDDNNRVTLEALKEAKKSLKVRELEVIEALFPDEGEPPTLKELGSRFDVSESRISQIRSRALKKLKEAMEITASN